MKEIIKEKSDDEIEEIKPYGYFEQVLVKKIQHYYLSEYIAVPKTYIEMIHNISIASIDETIIIHINNGGGNLNAGIQLINAMKHSKAHIICSLEGKAYSLASLIFLAGDEFLLHSNSLLMIHDFSGMTLGKGNEQKSELAATLKWFEILARDYYVPFISEKELKEILNGKDMWLQTNDIRKRLNKMVKIIQEEKNKK